MHTFMYRTITYMTEEALRVKYGVIPVNRFDQLIEFTYRQHPKCTPVKFAEDAWDYTNSVTEYTVLLLLNTLRLVELQKESV